jgi:hypothetical protein
MQLAAVRDEVGMPQPQRLPHPHPRLGKKDHKEPVPQVLAGLHDRQQLLVGQRARHPAGLAHPQRPGRDRTPAGGMVQERLEPAPVAAPPRHQLLRQRHPVTGLIVIKAEQRGQVPVHRRR